MLQNFEFNKLRSAADLYTKVSQAMGIDNENPYYDRKSQMSPEDYQLALKTSTTLYVGGISPFTFE